MEYLTSNIAAINANPNHIILENKEFEYEYVISDNDTIWYLDKRTNKSYAVKDITDKSQNINHLKRELIFVIGINSSELIDVVNKANKNSFIVVYEPNYAFYEYALNNTNLEILQAENIALIVGDHNQLKISLDQLLSTKLMLLTGNVKFYFSYFYRTYNLDYVKDLVKTVSFIIRSKRWAFGDSIQDCLVGTFHNLENLLTVAKSLDTRKLKGKFHNKPAVIISAGPSFEKNFRLLKDIKDRVILISTESILQRLLSEGIVPHFVASIERVYEAYEQSYKGKVIPREVTLIGPSVLYPKIFEEYQGKTIVPMREGVSEFMWFSKVLGLEEEESFIQMGNSTAHLAFGFARHIGANPIVLIGQDLAYSETGKDHASGTMYDELGGNPYNDPILDPGVKVEGYHGGQVVTNRLWEDFKSWFEYQIDFHKLPVINATEGGAKIKGTIQMSLEEVIKRYCKSEIHVEKLLAEIGSYNLDLKNVSKNMYKELREIINIKETAEKIKIKLNEMQVTLDKKKNVEIIGVLKESDALLDLIYSHRLVLHSLQPEIVNVFYKIYQIEEKFTRENVLKNFEIQKDFVITTVSVLDALLVKIQETLDRLNEYMRVVQNG